MPSCPHPDVRFCPLYVAAHHPGAAGCDDGRLGEGGCATGRGMDYVGGVAALRVAIPAWSPRPSSPLTERQQSPSGSATCAPPAYTEKGTKSFQATDIEGRRTLGGEIRFRADDPSVGASMTIEVHDDVGTFRWTGVIPEDQGNGTVILRCAPERAVKIR